MKNERIREEYPELINIFADILCDNVKNKKMCSHKLYPADEHPRLD